VHDPTPAHSVGFIAAKKHQMWMGVRNFATEPRMIRHEFQIKYNLHVGRAINTHSKRSNGTAKRRLPEHKYLGKPDYRLRPRR
jgi:hypothetical protein